MREDYHTDSVHIMDCTHAVLTGGMCVRCCKVLPESERASRIDVSKEKLALVLDLDHTLVHAVCARFLHQEYDVSSEKFKALVGQAKDLHFNTVAKSWIKVRPGVRDMLEALKSTYKMYIYTMGTKAYAEEVRKILDPRGDIFGKRVLSRCDTPKLSIKLLSKLRLADADTLIVDDTPEVWNEHRRNLLQIERYTFFPQQAGKGCLFSQKHDEDGDRNNLAFIHKTLQRVADEHTNAGTMDCRDTLARLRRKILRGYRLHVDKDVHTGYAKMACEMGATLSPSTNRITHHVTKTIVSGKSTYTLVSPKWILYCYMFLHNVPVV